MGYQERVANCMIRILTKPVMENCIRDFEAFFKSNVLSKDFTEVEESILAKIDSAYLLDKNTGCIRTQYGVTDIFHLSTSCKVVLSYLYIQRNKADYKGVFLDVTECGASGLEVLFDCVDRLKDDDTVFILRHSNLLYKCSDRDYEINGNPYSELSMGMMLEV